jgi:UDP-N-acetylmuramoyl-tripeptide--D-alanyl-D-alanine ligase
VSRPLWTGAEVLAATGGAGPSDWAAEGVSIDSRSLQKGDLFVALKDQRDGHDFVAGALAGGAVAALVSRRPEGVAPGAPLIVVPDVLKALEALAAAARTRFRGRVVAVTGSAGKTSTKEMLRAMFGALGPVHAAEKSFNNHWGVPLTLARMPREAAFAVVEIGMNHPGEIEPLARLTRPDAAIVTTVAAVHLAAFPDVAAITREKAAIFRGLGPGATAILNRDIPTARVLVRAARRQTRNVITFGAAGRPSWRLGKCHVGASATCVVARNAGRDIMFRIAAPGRHLAMNALAALAAVQALGGDLARASLALASWTPPAGRGTRWQVALGPAALDGAVTLIDESYNANPASMEAALEVLAATPVENGIGRVARGRRLAFLGDMLELGAGEADLHRALADLPALAAVDLIHAAGPRMAALHLALPASLRGEWHDNPEALARSLPRLLDAGDVAMVKGSNGARMSLVVDAILKLGDARPAETAGGGD